jgi:hypothetical protein
MTVCCNYVCTTCDEDINEIFTGGESDCDFIDYNDIREDGGLAALLKRCSFQHTTKCVIQNMIPA